MSYRLLCNGELIGHSQLEGEDPAMAVVVGRFVPTAGYEPFRSTFRLLTDAESETGAQRADPVKLEAYRQIGSLRLTLETDTGLSISTGWIQVRDFSLEAGEYEVSAHVDEPSFFVNGKSMRNPDWDA